MTQKYLTKALLICFLLLGSYAFAQQSNIDQRLLKRFTASELSKMQTSEPARLAYWTYYLDHSFQIMDIPTEKASGLTDLPVLAMSSANFNAFSIQLDTYQKDGATLRFQGEQRMLLVKPMKQLTEEFNTYYQSEQR